MDNSQFNGKGNGRYSAKAMAKPINFLCIAPEAQEVCVIGDFNEWDGNSHAMNRHFDGSWSTQIDLHHGHHRYQFLIDGGHRLIPAPTAWCATSATSACRSSPSVSPYFKQKRPPFGRLFHFKICWGESVVLWIRGRGLLLEPDRLSDILELRSFHRV